MRPTNSVFNALAWGMSLLGCVVAIGFPVFALIIGVPATIALTPRFVGACIFAGLGVAALNFELASRIVRPRLRRLADGMRHVRESMQQAVYSGDWSSCDPDACRIDATSRDELGAVADSYNALLMALHRAHRLEDDIRGFNQALSSRLDLTELGEKALNLLVDMAGADGGAIVLERQGEWQLLASRNLSAPRQLLESPAFVAHSSQPALHRITLPQGIAVDAVLANFTPSEVVMAPVLHHGLALGWVVLAGSRSFGDDVPRVLPLLTQGLGLALNNALLHDDLQRVAALDPLTGVYNRRFGLRRLDEELSRAERGQTPLSLMILDLDHFKRINDSFGHLAGDKVLVRTAAACRDMLREGDMLLRYGGEEFMIILPGAALPDATQVAERIRFAIKHTPVDVGEQRINVTASIGVAALSGQGPYAAEKFIEMADARLYAAKEAGRDRVVSELVQPARAIAAAH